MADSKANESSTKTVPTRLSRLSSWMSSILERVLGNGKACSEEIQTLDINTDIEKTFDIDQVTVPYGLTQKYDIGPVIGKGIFAFVLECTDKKTDQKHALKVFKKSIYEELEKMVETEIRILRRLKHPNVIQLYDHFTCKDYIYEIIELMNGGESLKGCTKYTEDDARGILYNLASGLEYIHSINIVHRQVKPAHTLINEHEDGTKNLKLGYFTMATEVIAPLKDAYVFGEPPYVAPEQIQTSAYGFKVDVWAAGIIAFHLLSGCLPFSSTSNCPLEIMDLIIAGKYDFLDPAWKDVSESAKDLVSGMLTMESEKRLSASQVLDHPWMSLPVSEDKEVATISKWRRFRETGKEKTPDENTETA